MTVFRNACHLNASSFSTAKSIL